MLVLAYFLGVITGSALVIARFWVQDWEEARFEAKIRERITERRRHRL